MSEVILREYRSGEWEAMYALDLICFEPPFRFSRRAMRGFAEAPNAIALLVEEQGKLVAFCVTHVEQGVGYVVTLDVAPEWRRKGLAARLIAESEARAHLAGTVSMALHVFTGNSSAIRFYDALAYQQLGVVKDFYGRGLDAFIYVKGFTESGGE